jgi:hypothetical protein
MATVAVELELGPKRHVFAHTYGWVGWSRAGRDVDTAIAALLAAGARYALVAQAADVPLVPPQSAADVTIGKRIAGNAVADFGAPSALFASDLSALDAQEIDQMARLLEACWSAFEAALRRTPAALHPVKPARGRSVDAIRLHLVDTDRMHLSAFGPSARPADPSRVAEEEAAVRGWLLISRQRFLARQQASAGPDPRPQSAGQAPRDGRAHRLVLPAGQEPVAQPHRAQVGPCQARHR